MHLRTTAPHAPTTLATAGDSRAGSAGAVIARMIDIALLATVTGGFQTTPAELQEACNKGSANPPSGFTRLQGCLAGVAEFAANKEDDSWRSALQSVLDSRSQSTPTPPK